MKPAGRSSVGDSPSDACVRIPESRRGRLATMLLSWVFLCWAGNNAALALDPATGIQQYNHQTWSRQNGLPVSGITAIAQARDGYLWFGSAAGLVRFDGAQFQLHDFHAAV